MEYKMPHNPTRPYWVTPQQEIETRKLMHLSKLQAVKYLRDLAPFDYQVPDPEEPTGLRMVRSSGLKELKDYVDSLNAIKDPTLELLDIFTRIDAMRREIEFLQGIEIANLLNGSFPELSDERKSILLNDHEELKKFLVNTHTGNQYGI